MGPVYDEFLRHAPFFVPVCRLLKTHVIDPIETGMPLQTTRLENDVDGSFVSRLGQLIESARDDLEDMEVDTDD
jgi:hypothetical protein